MATEITVFYAADLHGGDVCFKKWLRAGEFYGADVVVIGGDLTGKVLVPMYPAPGGGDRRQATWHGRTVTLETRDEVAAFRREVRGEGSYAVPLTHDEVAEIEGSIEKEREVFARAKREALGEWVEWAEERLAGSKVRAVVMPGNDDPTELDEVLEGSRRLENVQGRAVELAPGIWMASRGESTPTPWNTPRELPDEELGERAAKVIAELPQAPVTVWNLHMPPHDSGVDRAPKLDGDLNVQYAGSGEPIMVPVGSRTIRRLIEEHQPTLTLHGHIHEGRGRFRFGRSVGFNPGSAYTDGTLMGVLVRLSTNKGVRHYSFTTG